MKIGTKLTYTGRKDQSYFTVGSQYEIIGDSTTHWYVTDNSGIRSNGGKGHLWPKEDIHESFQPLPTGPVVTETVTKTRIVPGTYDGVTVSDVKHGYAHVQLFQCLSADQLDAAAAVLSALAKGLRDA